VVRLVRVTEKGKEKTEEVVRLNMLLAKTKVQVTGEGGEQPALVSPKSGGNLMVIVLKDVELELPKLISRLLEDCNRAGLLKLYDEIPMAFS
jgi:hypothetical protein